MSELPSIIQQAKNYKQAHDKWVAAGKPLRTPERIAGLFAQCEQCPLKKFMRVGKDIGRCTECGCWLKRKGEHFNKLAWPTEACPHGVWPSEIEDGPV